MLVDVAINYYGKPYHTMVALGSLLAHSGHVIDRIYLIKERQQPAGAQIIDDLLAQQDWRVETFTPAYYLGWQRSRGARVLLNRLLFGPRKESFRRSYRYQYALEKTDKRWLFLTHNDVLFQGDVLTPLIEIAEGSGHAGVGDKIGRAHV